MTQRYSTQLAARLGRKLKEDDRKRFAEQLDAAVASDTSTIDAMDHRITSSDLDARIDAALSVGLPREVVDDLINSYAPASTAKKTPLLQSKKFWFPAMAATAVAGPAIGLAVSLFGDSQEMTPQTVDVAPTVEVMPVVDAPQVTPIQQYKAFERAERDSLFEAVLTTTGKNSLIATMQEVPNHMTVWDRDNEARKITVGPEEFLFDAMIFDYGSSWQSPTHKLDSYDVLMSAMISSRIEGDWNPASAYGFDHRMDAKRSELGVNLPERSDMEPFYASIRDPTESDLRIAHRFVSTFVPDHVVNSIYGEMNGAMVEAQKIIDADPMLLPAKSYCNGKNMKRGICYISSKADLESGANALKPTRAPDGELIMGEGYRWNGFVLPEEHEKASPMAKWFFRRGSRFMHNFKVIADAYHTTNNPDDFVDRVMDNVLISDLDYDALR